MDVPDSLLVRCESDPKITTQNPTIQDVINQSTKRRARLLRCSERVESFIKWAEENQSITRENENDGTSSGNEEDN